MAKFQEFNPEKQIHGLAEAARQIAKEERESQNNDKDIEFRFGATLKQEGPSREIKK